MGDYIKKIRTNEGDKQIDYNALANLPELQPMDMLYLTDDTTQKKYVLYVSEGKLMMKEREVE